MSSYDEKLNDFIRHVMQEANQKKETIEQEMNIQRQNVLEEKELEFLTAAYETIQREKHKAEKQGNDEISKVTLEEKRALVMRREKMVDALFEAVKKRLETYRQSDGYRDFLLEGICQAAALLGDGAKTVFLDEADLVYRAEIEGRFSQDSILVEKSQTPLLGGFRMKNRDTNQLVDDSFLMRMEEAKARFIRESGLKIDA